MLLAKINHVIYSSQLQLLLAIINEDQTISRKALYKFTVYNFKPPRTINGSKYMGPNGGKILHRAPLTISPLDTIVPGYSRGFRGALNLTPSNTKSR